MTVQEREELLASFSVDEVPQVLVSFVSRVEPRSSGGILEALAVVAGVPHVEHVVQALQEACDLRALRPLGILGELPESAGVIHEDGLRQPSTVVGVDAPHDVRDKTREHNVDLRAALPKLVLVPIQGNPAPGDSGNDSAKASSAYLLLDQACSCQCRTGPCLQRPRREHAAPAGGYGRRPAHAAA